MSHLLIEYAKHLGVKTGRGPVLGEHFIPVPYEKYILIDISSPSQACQYPYWEEVVSLLRSSIPNEIKICLIRDPNRNDFLGEDFSFNNLSIKQYSYVIRNSLAHICVYGFSHHIASAYNVPSVVMFPNNHPDYVRSIWSENTINLKADYKNGKPSFAASEESPVIYSIYPDTIVDSLSKLSPEICSPSEHNVHFIGESYSHKLLEVIPDFFFNVEELQGRLINVRMDLNFDEDILRKWLQNNRCSIISDRPLSLDLCRTFKRTLTFINFFCDAGQFPDVEYLQELKSLGVKFKLWSSLPADDVKDELNKYFNFDFDLIDLPDGWPKNFPEDGFFISKKKIFCKNGIFYSRAHFESMDRSNKVIKSLDFLKEIQHFYIYDKK